MLRYQFTVSGMDFVSVLPWDAWPEEWQAWFKGLVAAQRATDRRCGHQRTTMIYVDNYNAELNSIRWHAETELVVR
jgi:hypothetical protein